MGTLETLAFHGCPEAGPCEPPAANHSTTSKRPFFSSSEPWSTENGHCGLMLLVLVNLVILLLLTIDY